MNNKFIIPDTPPVRALIEYAGLSRSRVVNAEFFNQYQFSKATKLDYVRDSPVATSALGTPVMCNITLGGVSYYDTTKRQNQDGSFPVTTLNDRSLNTNSNNGAAIQQTGNFLTLDTIIIKVNQSIKIVKTDIQGMDGSVKEYINKSDAKITIYGIIVGRNGVYPLQDVTDLKAWLDAPVSKPLICDWLNLTMGITDVVIDSYSIPQDQGGQSYQLFSFEASSDYPAELLVTVPGNGTS